MAYQTPDSKKEEFRKYLEKSGVIDALTKVLVGLYEEPERPPNAVDYVKRYLGAPTGVDVEAIRAENDTLKKENAELKTTIEELNARVSTLSCANALSAAAVHAFGDGATIMFLVVLWQPRGLSPSLPPCRSCLHCRRRFCHADELYLSVHGTGTALKRGGIYVQQDVQQGSTSADIVAAAIVTSGALPLLLACSTAGRAVLSRT